MSSVSLAIMLSSAALPSGDHGSTFDIDDTTTMAGTPIISTPNSVRTPTDLMEGKVQQPTTRTPFGTPSSTHSNHTVTTLHSHSHDTDEELADQGVATEEVIFEGQSHDEDWNSAKDQQPSRLCSSCTCWCPAMIIFFIVIGSISTAIYHMVKDKDKTPQSGEIIPVLDSTELRNLLQDRLQRHTLSTAFLQPSSPQAQAISWLVSDLGVIHQEELEDMKVEQRFALLVFAMSSNHLYWSGIVPWTMTAPNSHECQWAGVTCSTTNEVTSIVLIGVGASGTFPEEIGLLTHLTHLDVSKNGIEGFLPKTLFQMTTLGKPHSTQS